MIPRFKFQMIPPMNTAEIHEGSTRTVFICEEYAIKIPKNELGRMGNLEEARLWTLYCGSTHERKNMLCPVLWCDSNGGLLIMPRAIPLPPQYDLEDLPDWGYIPSDGHQDPTETKLEDWGQYEGKVVAVDYARLVHF